MKAILLCLLLAGLITATHQKTLDIVGPLTKTAFGCLVQLGYTDAIVRADSDTPGAVDPNAIQTLENAQIAGLSTDVYVIVCPSTSFFNQMVSVVQTIPSNLYTTLWFKLVQNHPGCSW